MRCTRASMSAAAGACGWAAGGGATAAASAPTPLRPLPRLPAPHLTRQAFPVSIPSPVVCLLACLPVIQHWRKSPGALPRHLHTQVGPHASLSMVHAPRIPSALRACLACSTHRHAVLQADASEAAGRQNSATSTAASAAVPGEVLPLRRLHKRRAFTPTVEQVRHPFARYRLHTCAGRL